MPELDEFGRVRPQIPIETQKRMHAFFMKTSAPRLMDDEVRAETEKEVSRIVEKVRAEYRAAEARKAAEKEGASCSKN